jgi:hypothetical protein
MTATLSRRSALTAGVALAAGTAVNLGALAVAKSAPLTGRADPIYAAIEAHHDAYAAWEAFLKRGDDESDEANEAEAIEHDAMQALLQLPATTAGGLIWALGYLESDENDCYPAIAEDVSSFLMSVALAVGRIVGVAVAHPVQS